MYDYLEEEKIYINKKAQIVYSDGSEAYLLKLFSDNEIINNLYNDPTTLHQYIVDWPTLYHLGWDRSNVIRAFNFSKKYNVLELGCGCGAITQYLVSHFNSVHAVEGNFQRALITRKRCSYARNLKVFCTDISSFESKKQYDLIFLIGVLEYSPKYLGSYTRFLKQILKFLKPNGLLLIAIENKFGLKYWLGFPEDHTGRVYDGLYDYPSSTPYALSVPELKKILNNVGLTYVDLYAAFPDYKFLETIFLDNKNVYDYYIHNWISFPFIGYPQRKDFRLNEIFLLKSLSKDHLLGLMSNSIVALCSRSNDILLSHRFLIKRLSTKRKRPYATVTFIDNNSTVRKEPLVRDFSDETITIEANPSLSFLHYPKISSSFHKGDLLIFNFAKLFYTNNLVDVKKLFREYHDFLLTNFRSETNSSTYPFLDGKSFDVLPRNIVVSDFAWKYFDTEWIALSEIPIDLVLVRAIMFDLLPLVQMLLPNSPLANLDYLIFFLLNDIFLNYPLQRYNKNVKICFEFNRYVLDNQRFRFCSSSFILRKSSMSIYRTLLNKFMFRFKKLLKK